MMLRILLPFSAVLVACSPSPQEAPMRSSSPPGTTAREPNDMGSDGRGEAAPNPVGQGAGDREHAAQGPIPEAVSAAENPAPVLAADLPTEALGRRTLSTAFVMVGPDGHLTVELRDGRALVLRDVVMRAKDYCGMQVLGLAPGTRYCGGYADVVAARPGGSPTPGAPDPVGVEHRPIKRP